MQKQYLTVSALTKYLKMKLENDQHLQRILIKGELSNFKAHDRGHFYFTLKDDGAQISAMMFSNYAKQLNFKPKEGDHVLIEAGISLYEARGNYNLSVYSMTLDGIGELYLKYEALKKEFELKGYFNQEHKKAIPKFPNRIGVITSATGAVIEDIKNTVARRYLLTSILLYPTLVQGEGAKENIAKQIMRANQEQKVDVIILGRGGGSIEDLWAFNEREVIEAIYQSKIPIITAIGHETDFTISDYVSDLRAPTPTAAAELATPNTLDLLERIKENRRQIDYHIKDKFKKLTEQLIYLDQRLDISSPKNLLNQLKKEYQQHVYLLTRNFNELLENKQQKVKNQTLRLISPKERLLRLQQSFDHSHKRLSEVFKARIIEKTYQFSQTRQQLESANPLKIMDRGFALTHKEKKIVTSVEQLNIDDTLEVQFKDGKVTTKIIAKESKK